ncbi:MAG: hypothetical protein NC084_02640 [Bacteroides sp.]|nr:hypothetical protein [Eubacterium sp.]MCM1417413.1 hypothetical protein [Roseburia sp.]MCM1461592.1 hypothetical protein [Bacteroides sp.]
MKRKILSFLCALTLSLSLCGCNAEESEPIADTPAPTAMNKNDEPAAPADAPTSAPALNQKENEIVVRDTDEREVATSSKPSANTTVSPPTEPSENETDPAPAESDTIDKLDETPPLREGDIEMTITEETITDETERLTLRYRYVGDAVNAEYCFGAEYTLERLTDGEWQVVPFSEIAAFDELGYLIGTESPNQYTEVSLRDGFYDEPLIGGTYRVVKPIGEITLTAKFEIQALCRLPLDDADWTIEAEEGSYTLQILEIYADGYLCQFPWPYPARFTVLCDPSDYPDFCVGDNIEVEFAALYKRGDWEYRIAAEAVYPSDYALDPNLDAKPVIYLYPEEETKVEVKLDYRGRLTVTYPEYKDGWRVVARPDGTLTDEDGNEYSYLFWEGDSNEAYDLSEGFCIKGEDTAAFLREKLALLGLTPREYNEFIVYWLPKMQNNPYNVIYFQGEAYTDRAALTVTPAPDTILRVFMAYYPSETAVELPEQVLTPTERKGFTLVEWGGRSTSAVSSVTTFE